MRVSQDGTKPMKHKVIEYTDFVKLFESENCKSILPLPVSGTGLQTKLAGSKMADISQVPFWRVCRLKRRRSP